MLEFKIKCESVEEARVYLNAPQYHNLISDLYTSLHGARKHGTEADVVRIVDNFMLDLFSAIEHSKGAY